VCLVSAVTAGPIRWGILGPGRIAHDFAGALRAAGSEITAVAAGSLPMPLERAQAFAKLFDIPNAYGSYLELAQDPNVDIVYIATVNFLHYENAMLILSHGKHVLLEKPATMNQEQLIDILALANSKDLFFSTNFWTRLFPAFKHLRHVVESGQIGRVTQMIGDMGFIASHDMHHDRFWNKTVGGGGLLDIGCYLIQYGTMLNNGSYPDIVQAAGTLNEYGVDIDVSTVLYWKQNKALATFTFGLERTGTFSGIIFGTQGRIEINGAVNCPSSITVYKNSDGYGTVIPLHEGVAENLNWDKPSFPTAQYGPGKYPEVSGFVYTIGAVETALREGRKFLDETPQIEQLVVVKIADEIRRQIGVVWDFEQ
jgi:dihydrodiol dehydrogenase / D-xylose 1-dehydrogenase (NADP)